MLSEEATNGLQCPELKITNLAYIIRGFLFVQKMCQNGVRVTFDVADDPTPLACLLLRSRGKQHGPSMLVYLHLVVK